MNRIIAIITAAGRASRMGRSKALLPWEGRPLVAHQVAQLEGCREIAVVLGHDPDPIRAVLAAADLAQPATIIDHPDWARGRSSSIAAAIRPFLAGPEPAAFLITGVDQPLHPDVVDALIAAFDPTTDTLLIPIFQGRRGHPLIAHGRLRSALAALEDAPEGLRTLVHGHPCREIPVQTPQILLDLNTPTAYADALKNTL